LKVIQEVGRRKTAVARATLRDGKGRIYINGIPLEIWEPELARRRISEPLLLAPDLAKKVDIWVKVEGGGWAGQADAVRTAIARALLQYDPSLRETFKKFDWTLVKSDVRKKERKKPGGPGARAKFQKSYR
jgi:small subunit ribosomal protein S9